MVPQTFSEVAWLRAGRACRRCPTVSSVSARPISSAAVLQDVLDEFRSRRDVPGLSAAVLLGERDPWAGAAGVADPERDRPMTPATQFAIGSMTKSFVAALVLRLIERKHLARHDPIASYLPTGIDSNGATVEDVLAHRSGIPEHVTPRFVAELLREPSRAWTPAEVLRYQEGPAGSRGRSAYSSTNYILLGMAVEHISGVPLGTSMRELLLDPVRLDRVIYQGTGAPPTPRATGLTHFAGEVPVAIRDTSGLLPCRSVATAAGAAGGEPRALGLSPVSRRRDPPTGGSACAYGRRQPRIRLHPLRTGR